MEGKAVVTHDHGISPVDGGPMIIDFVTCGKSIGGQAVNPLTIISKDGVEKAKASAGAPRPEMHKITSNNKNLLPSPVACAACRRAISFHICVAAARTLVA